MFYQSIISIRIKNHTVNLCAFLKIYSWSPAIPKSINLNFNYAQELGIEEMESKGNCGEREMRRETRGVVG